jgi:hypothetical protein
MTKQEVNEINSHDKDCSTIICGHLSDRINNNDPYLDRLDLKEVSMVHCSPSFPTLVKTIRSGNNTTIHTVVVGEQVVQMMTSSEQLSELLEALGGGLRASLQRVEIALHQLNDRTKGIAALSLARFLQQACNIQMLILWPFVCFESQHHVQMVADAMANHANLRDLSLLNSIVQNNENENNTLSLDPLLKSLATVPNLANLQLSPGLRIVQPRNYNNQNAPQQQQPQQHPSEPPCLLRSPQQSLRCLLQGTNMLQSLALRNIGLKDDDIAAMVRTLAGGTAGPLHQKQHTITTTTSTAAPLLQYLDLRFIHCCADETSSKRSYLAFLHLLRDHNNCRITYIDLEDKYSNKVNSITGSSTAISSNNSIANSVVADTSEDSKNKDNDSLLSLQEIKDQVDFYLHLNRAGRHAFLKDARASKRRRVDILIASRHDVNLSFYFLRQNPCVCE